MTFAIAYLLCVLVPPAALAWVGNSQAYHCLTKQHEFAAGGHAQTEVYHARAHVHHVAAVQSERTSPHHVTGHKSEPKRGGSESKTVNCCGYFCLSAMPVSLAADVGPVTRVSPHITVVDHSVAGRRPDRIDRPPKVLLPL